MIDINFQVNGPYENSYNILYSKDWHLTKTRKLELSIINKSYTLLKFSISIDKESHVIIGLCRLVLCLKIKNGGIS